MGFCHPLRFQKYIGPQESGEVPCRETLVGAHHEGAFRRAQSGELEAAFSRADYPLSTQAWNIS